LAGVCCPNFLAAPEPEIMAPEIMAPEITEPEIKQAPNVRPELGFDQTLDFE